MFERSLYLALGWTDAEMRRLSPQPTSALPEQPTRVAPTMKQRLAAHRSFVEQKKHGSDDALVAGGVALHDGFRDGLWSDAIMRAEVVHTRVEYGVALSRICRHRAQSTGRALDLNEPPGVKRVKARRFLQVVDFRQAA